MLRPRNGERRHPAVTEQVAQQFVGRERRNESCQLSADSSQPTRIRAADVNSTVRPQEEWNTSDRATDWTNMKPQKRLDYLCSLREEIAGLRVVKCHMSHERVVRAADSGLPLICRVPEGSYQRVGLCSPEARAQRLGCSHTMARIKLERAIDVLGAEDSSGTGSFSGNELNWLNNEIHLLDHQKGEAEKALARILEEAYSAEDRARNCQRLREAEEKIRKMEELHDEYVERLGVLRDRVVTEIDKLIEEVGMNPYAFR